MKIIALILSIIFVLGSLSPVAAKEYLWSGNINLKEDLIIPAEDTLTISPGTKVFTNGNKIISYGTLNIFAEENKIIEFTNLIDQTTAEIEIIKIKPYDVDTETLKSEFNSFKLQYAILWSVLFASTFLLVEMR